MCETYIMIDTQILAGLIPGNYRGNYTIAFPLMTSFCVI